MSWHRRHALQDETCAICWELLTTPVVGHSLHHGFHRTCLQRWWSDVLGQSIPNNDLPCPCCGRSTTFRVYSRVVYQRAQLVDLIQLTPAELVECVWEDDVRGHDDLDISRVRSLDYLLETCPDFNYPIGRWDTSNVTSMKGTFSLTTHFNQPIGTWNVSRVTSMDKMFFGAAAFNQPIEAWDVSRVRSMESMFESAIRFDQPLAQWHLICLRNANSMFLGARVFNQPIDGWYMSNVTDIEMMFQEAAAFNQSLASWDVSSVRSMENLFYFAAAFRQPIYTWSWNVQEEIGDWVEGSGVVQEPEEREQP